MIGERLADRLRFTLPQQSMIDKDAGQLIADRPVDQGRRDGAVHASAEAADHSSRADRLPDLPDRALGECAHGPGRLAAAFLAQEIPKQLDAPRRVSHFGMELHAPQPALRIAHRRHRRVLGASEHLEPVRRRVHAVPMAHPADEMVVQAGEDRVRPVDPELRLSELPLCARNHCSPELPSHELHSITDAQDRQTQFIQRRVDQRRSGCVDAVRAARKHDPPRLPGQDLIQRRRIRQQLAVHAALADTAGDQLAILGAKIEDEDGRRGGGCHLIL